MSTFELKTTFVHLADGGDALPVPVTPSFWPELMGQAPRSEGTRRIADDGGWLVAEMPVTGDMQHWERHPEGDELLVALSGELVVVFEQAEGEARVALRAGQTCRVPQGVWHRFEVVQPGRLLAMTYGRGTDHKPRSA